MKGESILLFIGLVGEGQSPFRTGSSLLIDDRSIHRHGITEVIRMEEPRNPCSQYAQIKRSKAGLRGFAGVLASGLGISEFIEVLAELKGTAGDVINSHRNGRSAAIERGHRLSVSSLSVQRPRLYQL